ncbi:MAG: glycosyltransferase family 2 protein [Phycisphaerae bacterium]
MNDKFKATLVITTRNRVDELRNAIASALAQTIPLEIIVLDDASTDGTAEAVRSEFPEAILVVESERQGYIRLRNKGAAMAKSPIIISIDDDAVFTTPRIVEQTLAEFDNPRVGAVAIPFVNVNTSPEVKQRAPDEKELYVINMYIGTAHALRRDIFLRLGGYREFFEHQGEEPDYCIRMLDAGYIVRLGREDVIHHLASPKRDLSRMHFYGTRNSVLLVWCNFPTPWVYWRMLRTILGNLLYAARIGAVGIKSSAVLAGLRDCVRFRAQRHPIRPATYHLLTQISGGPMRLEDVEKALPPLDIVSQAARS